ncbi:hypothetical protein BD311DRAFT_787781 [Dichomitus squalens]|uniref:Uncharacterized protein n=1 Tax=Dichomitus squalens TaxID=114155 RepID=A0A4Q9MSQ3_9APHY|nr:hypothetical protein BD311DRAFT_787781 [Dichomitus squalens]
MQHDHGPFQDLNSNNHPVPQAQGRQRDQLPVARFLLGMGPMPPPRPEEVAVAYTMAALNAGHFPPLPPPPPPYLGQQGNAPGADPPQPLALGAPGPENHYRAVGPEQISVLLPINTTRDGEQVIQASFKIPSNLPPLEFLRQVQRLMGVDPDKPVRIGYRVVPSNKSEPFVRFETEEDVANAMMSTLTRMKRAVSRTVQLELSNLDYKPGTAASSTSANGTKKNEPPKSQSAFQDELRICREKLHCERCSLANGTPTWCYIDRRTGEHVRLYEEHVSLWARLMHNEECDRECRIPPNCLKLDELRKQTRDQLRRRARNKTPVTAPHSTSHIHVHVGSSHWSRRSSHHRSSRHRSHHSRSGSSDASPSASSESSSSSNEDESDAEGESLSISEVLAALDMKQPASHYPKYQDALTAQGVVYARSALDFSVKWYVQEIKMPEGLVRPFLRQVQTMLRKRHRQSRENTDRHKRVRIGNENIDPVLLA